MVMWTAAFMRAMKGMRDFLELALSRTFGRDDTLVEIYGVHAWPFGLPSVF